MSYLLLNDGGKFLLSGETDDGALLLEGAMFVSVTGPKEVANLSILQTNLDSPLSVPKSVNRISDEAIKDTSQSGSLSVEE